PPRIGARRAGHLAGWDEAQVAQHVELVQHRVAETRVLAARVGRGVPAVAAVPGPVQPQFGPVGDPGFDGDRGPELPGAVVAVQADRLLLIDDVAAGAVAHLGRVRGDRAGPAVDQGDDDGLAGHAVDEAALQAAGDAGADLAGIDLDVL